MTCDICKNQDASIFLQRNVKNLAIKYYLCKNCAKKFNISSDPNNLDEAFSKIDEITKKRNAELLESGMKDVKSNFKSMDSMHPNLTKICPACGSTFDEIFNIKKIGCAECYHSFEDEFLKRYDIKSEYRGNLPKRLKGYRSTLTDRVDIRMKLEQAVANEEYEKAALYRDYLKVLEKKQNLNGEINQNESAGAENGNDNILNGAVN